MSTHTVKPNLFNNELSDKQLDEVSRGTQAHSDFSVAKPVDAATPKLYEAACEGTHIPEVTI